MKKTTLIMLASASMLFAAPAMNDAPVQGQLGQGAGQGLGLGKGAGQGLGQATGQGQGPYAKKMNSGKMCCSKTYRKSRMVHRKMNSPFLIKDGLPSMMRKIMPFLNDPAFALTAEQKVQLDKIQSESLASIMKIKPEVIALRKEIINASRSGTSPKALEEKVGMLAVLEARATMTQLKCIEDTKNILTKDQLMYLLTHKKYKKRIVKKRNINQSQKFMRRNIDQNMSKI